MQTTFPTLRHVFWTSVVTADIAWHYWILPLAKDASDKPSATKSLYIWPAFTGVANFLYPASRPGDCQHRLVHIHFFIAYECLSLLE